MNIGKGHIITHRGIEASQKNYFSESSLEAFEDQLERGFGGIEFDPNPTQDGIIVMHDANLSRPTSGKDSRNVIEVSTNELIHVSLRNGHIPTFQQVMEVIRKSDGTINAMHLKARFQTPQLLERIIQALGEYTDVFEKLIVFDIKPDTARILKQKFPTLRLAPSIAHSYDIARYGSLIGNTLLTIDEAIALKHEGVIDGVWVDEWDTLGKNNLPKQFYTKENFDRLHQAGLFVALVTPELHGTSPGLYGGESHADAKDMSTLFERIEQIKEAGADYFCTDYPEEVARL